jgi:hypothetical protein
LKRLQTELLGPVFETSVFAELIKQYGTDAVAYWRSTDKTEIDFILKRPEGPIPVEVKNHFPRLVPPVFKRFWRTDSPGSQPPFFVVGLYGDPTDQQMIYPWQLYR